MPRGFSAYARSGRTDDAAGRSASTHLLKNELDRAFADERRCLVESPLQLICQVITIGRVQQFDFLDLHRAIETCDQIEQIDARGRPRFLFMNGERVLVVGIES